METVISTVWKNGSRDWMVRDKKLVLDNACQALENTVFSPLMEDRRLERLKRVLTEKRETL